MISRISDSPKSRDHLLSFVMGSSSAGLKSGECFQDASIGLGTRRSSPFPMARFLERTNSSTKASYMRRFFASTSFHFVGDLG